MTNTISFSELHDKVRRLERKVARLQELYESALTVIRRLQEERDNLLERAKLAILGAMKVDETNEEYLYFFLDRDIAKGTTGFLGHVWRTNTSFFETWEETADIIVKVKGKSIIIKNRYGRPDDPEEL